MRLPLYKVYRAFPELDRFSDSECESFVEYVRVRRGLRNALLVLVAVLLAVCLWAGLARVVFLARQAGLWSMPRDPHAWMVVLGTLWFITLPASAFAAGYGTRDLLLIRGVRARLRFLSCPGCGYSLLGLCVSNGRVKCPECGRQVALSDLGVRAEEILAGVLTGGEGTAQPTSASPNDSP